MNTDFDALYDALRAAVGGASVTPATLAAMAMHAMRVVERASQSDATLRKATKKAMAVRLIERLIGEVPMDAESRVTVQGIFAAVGPSLIDSLAEADKTQFLRSTHSWLKRSCGWCGGKA